MKSGHFIKESQFPFPAEKIFAWHCRPGALMRLTPPWERVSVISQSPDLKDGSETVFLLSVGPLKFRWKALHKDFKENILFRDLQEKGPFAFWEHTHRFIAINSSTSILKDSIIYRLPLHLLTSLFAGPVMSNRLQRMFQYRHTILHDDLKTMAGKKKLRIAVTGSSGLIGSSLVPYLSTQGHDVILLKRNEPIKIGEAFWDPENGIIDLDLDSVDAVIHLAGEPIGTGHWTDAKKKKIMESRIRGTGFLARAIAQSKNPPQAIVSASAIGYYGNRGDAWLHEESEPGKDFISEVCRRWEKSLEPARERGVRIVNARIGIALHPGGGLLKRLLLPARLGLGAVLGKGSQYISWITMEDTVRALEYLLTDESAAGPVNLAAPEPVTNREFMKTLAKVIVRPAFLKIPSSVISSLFGQMGREVLLSSTRVSSQKLEQTGFGFKHVNLTAGLQFLLGQEINQQDSAP